MIYSHLEYFSVSPPTQVHLLHHTIKLCDVIYIISGLQFTINDVSFVSSGNYPNFYFEPATTVSNLIVTLCTLYLHIILSMVDIFIHCLLINFDCKISIELIK